MIKINGREVTKYFTDKNYIKNLARVMDALCQTLCEEIGIENTPFTCIHFIEALMMYMKINSPEKVKWLSDKRREELALMYCEGIYSVDSFNVSIDWNEEPLSENVREYIKQNSHSLNKMLTNTYTTFKKTYDEDECPYCHYTKITSMLLITFIENSSFDIPFSMTLIRELMLFCMKNSRIVNLSNTEKNEFFNGHE